MKHKILALLVLASSSIFSQAQATNLVVNGGFEDGNASFQSSYTYSPAQYGLYPTGTYAVGATPEYSNPYFMPVRAHEGNNLMVVNGSATAGGVVWNQLVNNVVANTTYYFSTYVASVASDNPAQLSFSINGVQLNPAAPFIATADGRWKQFHAEWFSGANTSADLSLVNNNVVGHGNDFALDSVAMDTMIPSPVPEPETYALMGMGLLGLLAVRRRKLSAK